MSAPCSRVSPSSPFWLKLGKMATSKLGVATRAFVVVLLALARSYNLVLSVGRDSSQDALLKAYRKVLLKVHPDKCGNKADVQTLQFWEWIRKKLRKMDLPDFRNKRTPLNKAAYITRVKGVMRSHKAQSVARSCAARFRKTCKQVVERGGAAADN